VLLQMEQVRIEFGNLEEANVCTIKCKFCNIYMSKHPILSIPY